MAGPKWQKFSTRFGKIWSFILLMIFDGLIKAKASNTLPIMILRSFYAKANIHKYEGPSKFWKLHTTYISIFSISGIQRRAPRDPMALISVNWSGLTISWTWKTAVCMRVLKCFPIRPLWYCLMYDALIEGTDNPSISVDCRWITNKFCCTLLHDVWRLC